MTESDLEAKAARMARSLVPAVREASAKIDAKFADALSHARNAVTDTLKRTPDGRATIRRAGGSPSYSGALSRLDELWTWLCGPSVSSLEGYIRDWRERSYRQSRAEWLPFIPAEYRRSGSAEPTDADVRAIRGVALHGMDLRTEIGGPIGAAKRSLVAALALAGQRAASGRDSDQILKAWHLKARDGVLRSVRMALSDSQVDADIRSGRDLIHPDHLIDRPATTSA